MKPQLNIKELAALTDAETLYENAPCGYVSFTSDGTIFKINNTLLLWLQLTLEELNRLKFPELISKGGNIHFEMFFRPMINVYGSVKELRYELMKKDASTFTVLISANVIKRDDGKILAINAAIYDITDRKKYEHELLLAKKNADDERKRFTLLADLTPEIIWTANAEGKIDYVNQQFFNYWGIGKRQLSPFIILSKIHADDRKKLVNSWINSLKTLEELKCEIRLLNMKNKYYWHQVRAKPSFNEEGRISNWFGTCTNIDDHITAIKQKDEFISIASHELKTPITSLKGSLQLLDRLKDNPSHKMLPQLIAQANKSMLKITMLIDDLLNVSRIQEGQLQLNKTKFTMEEFWAVCYSSIAGTAPFKLVVQGELKLRVHADIVRLEQVVLNFVNNAIKYAAISKEVYFVVAKENNYVRVSLKDNGPGIPADKIPHLFERYYRADSSSSQYTGLGLGLYISADIIRRHGGEIGAESIVGEGSTFWFTLPVFSN